MTANMDEAPSQGIPGQISGDNVKEIGSGGRTHSPLIFRAAIITSVELGEVQG